MKTDGREQEPDATIEHLEKALEEERVRSEEYLSSWQRSQADFTNYKRRAEQERNDLTRSTNADLILSIVPILDDMERAFRSLPEESTEPAWTEGFRLIYRKLHAILESRGLKEIEATGRPFDPHFHEAIAYEDGGEEGIVVRETQKGYMLGDRVLCPCLVTVGRGTPGPTQIPSRKRGEKDEDHS